MARGAVKERRSGTKGKREEKEEKRETPSTFIFCFSPPLLPSAAARGWFWRVGLSSARPSRLLSALADCDRCVSCSSASLIRLREVHSELHHLHYNPPFDVSMLAASAKKKKTSSKNIGKNSKSFFLFLPVDEDRELIAGEIPAPRTRTRAPPKEPWLSK